MIDDENTPYDDAYVRAMLAEYQIVKRNTWDDECGYDLSDPKHPTYAERMADRIDEERSRRKDEPPTMV
jgi:hypothetical protein